MSLESRLEAYISNNEDPAWNFNLGLEYEEIGQTSSAISYYLRAAERCNDSMIAYESLLHMGHLYDGQGRRGRTAMSCWRKALCLKPKRPEAYYYISRYFNWHNEYDQGYLFSKLALEFCDFNLEPLICTWYINPNAYKVCLEFDKGLSAWWWGLVEESKSILVNLKDNHFHELPDYQKRLLDKYMTDELSKVLEEK
jgi:tetratricopeptide (TPR) repeat protein|tara:strand:- start:1360 stop:1950 length:591 start_codon:yes stop_codon:yes gene_type:complete